MMTEALPSRPLTMSNRPVYSCIRCSDRKVKCDRQRPCSACVRHNVDCVFNPQRPPRKRQARIKDLTDRLRHYESLLEGQGITPSKIHETSDSNERHSSSYSPTAFPSEDQLLLTPSSIDSEHHAAISKTQIVHGQGRSQFVDNSLWTRVVEEFPDPEDALEESSNDTSDSETSDGDFGFVLGSRMKSKARIRHPSPDRIHQLWQIYIERIDPLTKIVHVPTVRPAIEKAASNVDTIPRSFEALMVAIYSVAVMSLDDDECKESFDESRKVLLSRYISGTKVALARAKFMGTTSLVVLQALILHIISIRDIHEPRATWSLTGVALRIAQCMGLERDGASLGLPLFETEMRRRIWWLLKHHESRTAELCGFPKFRDLDTSGDGTKWVTNINDDQLYPGMTVLEHASNTVTDAVFIALRSELTAFASRRITRFREQGRSANQFDLHAAGSVKLEIEKDLKEVEETLETKYLRYCDPSQPLHFMVMLLGRAALNLMRFLTHHPRRWSSIEATPTSERQWIWGISLKLLEQHSMVMSNPQLKQFAWHASYFLHWHTFIHVLDTLRAAPLTTDAEKAWNIIGNIYNNSPHLIYDRRKSIFIAVATLCLKAYKARESAIQAGKIRSTSTPQFILQLRQQAEISDAKRQARDTRSNRTENSTMQNYGEIHNSEPNSETSINHVQGNTTEHERQSTSSLPYDASSNTTKNDSDPFWFVNRLSDNQNGNINDAMNVDSNFMFAQDSIMENNSDQSINWEQWDAWLADSNLVPPLSSVPWFDKVEPR